MFNRTVFPIVARLSAASAVLVLAVSTVLALPTAGYCRSQYEHMDITASPAPAPTPAPMASALSTASNETANGAALTALLSTTFLGFVASKQIARASAKKGL